MSSTDDKAVEVLSQLIGEWTGQYSKMNGQGIIEALDQAGLTITPKDISLASKEDPLENGECFVIVGAPAPNGYTQKTVAEVWWDDENDCWITGYFDGHPVRLGFEPTHFQLLPEPPEGT